MRNIKRMAALLLAVVLVLSCLPAVSVFAAELPEEEMPPATVPPTTGMDPATSEVTDPPETVATPGHDDALKTYLEEKRAGFPVGKPVTFMDEARIWYFLMELTGNPYGAAGAMGNLAAESDLKTGNLQNCWESILGYSDESYTYAVDDGTYSDFINDSAGYGLAQWTYHTRKARLYALAQDAGKSVSDLSVQLRLLEEELSSDPVLRLLQNTKSVNYASDIFLTEFERPLEISGDTLESRRHLAAHFYRRFALEQNPEASMTEAQYAVILAAAKFDGADTNITGQQWVDQVYIAAGLPLDGSCCAYHASEKNCVDDNWRDVPPGAAVYGYAGGEYGHVGLYVGGGLVCHYAGGVIVQPLADWVESYQGFCWGWNAGLDLTR